MVYDERKLIYPQMEKIMNIIRMGDASHSGDFKVLREHGYPHYLLLITKTPALFEYEGEWREAPAGCALLFRPGQRHSYTALGESYSDFWAHIQSSSPLLYEGFPFGRPIPLAAPERFTALFSVMLGEFFSARRTRESVLSSLCSALVEMLSSEVELKGTLFYSFLSLREDIFRSPECEWTAEGAAARLNLSKGYFHTLYKQYFGTTFLSDVIISRVQAAEDLLSSSQESVSRIAERCGYLNEEHFIRQFSQFTGTTPHRYRLKLKSQGAGKSSESVREL